jgi:ADP-ribose pyrophosphatase YjhB (NUDIX family)
MTEGPSEKPRRTRIAAYAILVRDGSILLVRCTPDISPQREWTLPGGGINFGEDPSHAAVREVKEETGFDIALRGLLAVDSWVDQLPEMDHHSLRIIYAGEITGGNLTFEIGGSTDACEWVRFDRADELPLVELAKFGVRLARQRAGSA